MTRPVLTLYVGPGCHLCEDARAQLGPLEQELGFDVLEVDISRDDALHRAYLERIPVGAIGGEELFEYFVDEGELRRRLA